MSGIAAHILLARAQSSGHIQWQGGVDMSSVCMSKRRIWTAEPAGLATPLHCITALLKTSLHGSLIENPPLSNLFQFLLMINSVSIIQSLGAKFPSLCSWSSWVHEPGVSNPDLLWYPLDTEETHWLVHETKAETKAVPILHTHSLIFSLCLNKQKGTISKEAA